MPKLPRRVFLVFAFDFILFFFCLVGTYRATLRATVPVQFQSSQGIVLVRSAGMQNVSPTLLPGDTVVAVDGLTVRSPKDVEFILDGLRIGEQATFGLRSNGVTVSRVVELVPFYGKPYFLIQLAVGVFMVLRAVENSPAGCLELLEQPTVFIRVLRVLRGLNEVFSH